METTRTTTSVRIKTIGNWDRQWGQVLALIERLGHRDSLIIDADGWLSARQVVLAAFGASDPETARPLGFIVFLIRPVLENRKPDQHPRVEAVLLAAGIEPHASAAQTQRELLRAAMDKAFELKCEHFHQRTRREAS